MSQDIGAASGDRIGVAPVEGVVGKAPKPSKAAVKL